MNETEFNAELLGLYVRAQNRLNDEPDSPWWPLVCDSLKMAVVASGHAVLSEPKPRLRPLPHIKPLTIPLAELKALEPLTKGVK